MFRAVGCLVLLVAWSAAADDGGRSSPDRVGQYAHVAPEHAEAATGEDLSPLVSDDLSSPVSDDVPPESHDTESESWMDWISRVIGRTFGAAGDIEVEPADPGEGISSSESSSERQDFIGPEMGIDEEEDPQARGGMLPEAFSSGPELRSRNLIEQSLDAIVAAAAQSLQAVQATWNALSADVREDLLSLDADEAMLSIWDSLPPDSKETLLFLGDVAVDLIPFGPTLRRLAILAKRGIERFQSLGKSSIIAH